MAAQGAAEIAVLQEGLGVQGSQQLDGHGQSPPGLRTRTSRYRGSCPDPLRESLLCTRMNDTRARRTTTLWTHSLKTLTLIAWLSVWTQRSAGQGSRVHVVNATVGQTANLISPVTLNILVVAWYRGIEVLPPQLIIIYNVFGSSKTTGLQSTGRESVSSDGTLTIRDLQMSDAGNYTVNVTPNIGAPTTTYRQLRVREKARSPPHNSSPGLSVGYIAGIVIGVLAVVIIVDAAAGVSA